MDKNLEISFYCTILFLNPSVSSRVKSCKDISFDTREVPERKSELRYKD